MMKFLIETKLKRFNKLSKLLQLTNLIMNKQMLKQLSIFHLQITMLKDGEMTLFSMIPQISVQNKLIMREIDKTLSFWRGTQKLKN